MDEAISGLLFWIFGVGGGTAVFFFLTYRAKLMLQKSLAMTLFLVRMPKYEKKEDASQQQDPRIAIGMMEQIYSHFLYLREQTFWERWFFDFNRVGLEIASEVGGSDISFYISVPNTIANGVEKYIQGVYPGAIVTKVPEDFTVFEPESKISASFMRLANDFLYPLNTYDNLKNDPLSSVANSLSDIQPDEGSAIQIIIKPSKVDLKARGEKAIIGMMHGKHVSDATSTYGLGQNNYMGDVFSLPGDSTVRPTEQMKQYQPEMLPGARKVDDTLLDAIRKKISKPVFDVNIRFVAVAKTQTRADQIVQNLEASFYPFFSNYNSFKVKKVKSGEMKKFLYDFVFRNFADSQRIVLNNEELASIYHFPLSHIESPNIKWAKSKESALPTNIPYQGVIKIGQAAFRGTEKDFYYSSIDDRRRHMYIVGQTGTGKSSLLAEMIRQDIANGQGVGVIDPHGDLIDQILANIPQNRIDDVVLFEPADTAYPVGLNMLEWDSPEQKDMVVSEMISIFTKLFPPEIIGPMFEHYMRNAMLALMANKDDLATLVEIPRIFTDEHFLEHRLQKVTDPIVKTFWLREWKQSTGQTRSDMLGYVVSKVGRFVENELMRNIIGQSKSGFDLAEIMNSGKIFLANLSKGKTGELNSSLLGLILISKMQVAAMRRASMPQDQRKDFYLYIDEFHNFTTDNIATILSEARKYRLNLILAHQYIPQLAEPIKNAVMGNVGTVCSFRIGAQDAEFLEKQYEPEFSRFDLVNLDNFYFLIKMMINNQIASPFKAKTVIPQKGNPAILDPIRKISRLKYAKTKAEVEMELTKRWNV